MEDLRAVADQLRADRNTLAENQKRKATELEFCLQKHIENAREDFKTRHEEKLKSQEACLKEVEKKIFDLERRIEINVSSTAPTPSLKVPECPMTPPTRIHMCR